MRLNRNIVVTIIIMTILVTGSWMTNPEANSLGQFGTPSASPIASPVGSPPELSGGTPSPSMSVGRGSNVIGDGLRWLGNGVAGELAVVAEGGVIFDGNSTEIPYVLKNSSDVPKTNVVVGAVVYDATGTLSGVVEWRSTYPETIYPGEYATGSVLEFAELPTDGTIEWVVNADNGEGYRANLPIGIDEVSPNPNGLLGFAINDRAGVPAVSTVTVFGACFDPTGNVTSTGYIDALITNVGPGDRTPFQFDQLGNGDVPCESFIVGAYGR